MIDSNDPRLTAYVLGELGDADQQAVEDAVANSPELRREVEEIRRGIDLLSGGLRTEPCPVLTDQQREKISEASTPPTGEAALSRPPIENSKRRRVALALAASLLIVACGVTSVLLLPSGKQLFRSRHVARTDVPLSVENETHGKDAIWLALDEPTEEEGESRSYSGRVNWNTAPPSADAPSADAPYDDRAPLSYPDVSEWGHLTTNRPSPSPAAEPAEPAPATSQPPPALGDYFYGDGAGYPAPSGMAGSAPRMPPDAPGMSSGMGMGMGGMGPAPNETAGGYPGMDGSGGRMDAYGEEEAYGGESTGQMMGSVGLPADLTPQPAMDGAANPSEESAPTRRDFAGEVGAVADPRPALRSAGEGDFDESMDDARGLRATELETKLLLQDLRKSDEAQTWSELRRRRNQTELAEPAATESAGATDSDRFAAASGGEAMDEAESEAKEATAEEQNEVKNPAKRVNKPKPATWRRAKATPNASRLMIGDRDELPLEGMQANVRIDGFRARVLLDCYYFNNRNQQLEGNFKLRLPNEASLYYFAFGESAYEYRPAVDQLAAKGFLSADLVRASGLDPESILRAREGSWSKVKEARVVPREKAAHAYSETVRRRVDPALVEWSGAGVFQTRVFPLMPNKLHRIVIGYDVTLQSSGDDLFYKLDLPEDLSQCTVDLNVAALPGMTAEVKPEAQPFTSGGRAYFHFGESGDEQVSVRLRSKGPMILAGKDDDAGDFFTARFTPDLPPGEEKAGASQAVFLVDTSLSSRPEKFNVWLDMLEAVLTNNRDSLQRFAVLFFNIESHWWQEEYTANTPENVDALLAYCHSLALEGATDLEQAFSEAAKPGWLDSEKKQPATDLFLLSDGAVTWGDMDQHRLGQILQRGSNGSLFAYKTGLTGTATAVLDHLARETGGAVFSIANPEEVEAAATGHRRRPWKLLEVELLGGSDILVAGRPQFVYPGQTLTVVGRGQPGPKATLRMRRGGENKTVNVSFSRVVRSELAPRAYGEVAVGQLEDLGSDLEDVSVAYARHFRVTGKTCSLLMLDSEQDYQRFNIKAEDDAFVIQSSPSADLITKKLDELAERLSDAKASFLAWLEKLESTPGFQFEVPTALRIVVERMPRESFEVVRPQLVCKQRNRGGPPKKYLQQLDDQRLDYSAVSAEAVRRLDQHSSADALRALSSLVEANPGDPVLTRDVAFSAMQWGLSGQAYPLLKRLAMIRPYEPQTYQALGQCLAELGNADLAMVYYEIAMHGQWHERYRDVNQIVSVEYLHLLRKIQREQLSVSGPEYTRGRLQSLVDGLPSNKADLIVTMMWNTDRTDVDLHVVEPSGEECYYEHPRTRSGGQVTRDVTEGYGPEMYVLAKAPQGKYRILANYFGSDANRTQVRTKVYITIYENFGGKKERIEKRTITLSENKEKRELASIVMKSKSRSPASPVKPESPATEPARPKE